MNETSSAAAATFDIQKIKKQALMVITNPVEFYRSMPAGGGFAQPLIFLVVLGLVTGAVRALFMLTTSFGAAIGLLVLTPVLAAVFGFVGAAIMMLIWKVMGSSQNYETAYRCIAYAAAVSPITTLVSFIPYLGGVAATAWGFYLMYVASVEVHRIAARKARMVWGILFAVFALLGISAEASSRRMQRKLENFQQQMESGDMTAEEAGKLVGDFLKGLEKSTQEK